MMAKSALPPEIQDIDDYTESMNFLIHGDSGSGKTVFVGGLPRALILAVEEGTISAKRRGSTAKVWKIKHWDDLVEAYEWVRDNPDVFDWVIIDTITHAQVRCLRGIMEAVVKHNSSRDPDIPAIQDHFKWQLLMKRMVTDWVELPTNVVFLAQSMHREDVQGEDIIVPLIEGKDYQISTWVCAQVHLLAYLRKEARGKGAERSMVRRLYVNDHPSYWCKDRYDVLGRVIAEPDINKVVKTIVDSGATPTMGGEPAAKKTAARKTARAKRAG